MMHRHGYGAARRIQLEIRRAWQFRFNWFFKSRSPEEIQKRCDVLVRVVEREVQECYDKEAVKMEGEEIGTVDNGQEKVALEAAEFSAIPAECQINS
jgi:SWI/SNF-related matrix-associated actin-dependent regulator of chromatin subfamily A member 5